MEKLHTEAGWKDLALSENTLLEVNKMLDGIRHGNSFLPNNDLHKKLKPGYRGLFYGPAGTEKMLAATLLGKTAGADVYRIDLSTVISKFIGETEKNLAAIFNEAQKHNWLLFFDEADALFGKRTQVGDAHDRYANQEVAYLLQRLEDYPGIIILSANSKVNLDSAFIRRFQQAIYFGLPDNH